MTDRCYVSFAPNILLSTTEESNTALGLGCSTGIVHLTCVAWSSGRCCCQRNRASLMSSTTKKNKKIQQIVKTSKQFKQATGAVRTITPGTSYQLASTNKQQQERSIPLNFKTKEMDQSEASILG